MSTRAANLFGLIQEGKALFLEQMVASRRQESHYLEFKGGQIEKALPTVKEHLSRSFSGFANTEGGVIVWGIRAARGTRIDGVSIDEAQSFEPISRPELFCQTLRDCLLEATQPPIVGVEIVPIRRASSAGDGLAVCYVPEGNDKPYRATLHPSRNYFQRLDDKFVIIQHSFLRSLFFPQSRALLNVEIRVERSVIGATERRTLVGLVGNVGNATARELWIVVKSSLPLSGRNQFNFKLYPGALKDADGWEAYQSIHPGSHIPVFYYDYEVTEENAARPIDLEIELYSQHQSPQVLAIHLSNDDILAERTVRADAQSRSDKQNGEMG